MRTSGCLLARLAFPLLLVPGSVVRAEPVMLEPVGAVRDANGSNTHWEAQAVEEILGLLDAGAAPAGTLELSALTDGSWGGGTAQRVAPELLELAQPHNVGVTLSLLRAGEGALGYYTESGDPASGGLVFDDLAGTRLQGYVKLGSVKDSLYFTLLEETGGASTYDVLLSSEFDADDFLMYAVPDNRYLFMSIDADPATTGFLDLVFQVEIGAVNANTLIAAAADAGGRVAAAPLPPVLWAVLGALGAFGLRRLGRRPPRSRAGVAHASL